MLAQLPHSREGLVAITGCAHPFKIKREDMTVAAGLTVAEILDFVQPDPGLRFHAHVFIGADYVPRDMWARVRPRAGARVTVRVVPSGGGGDKNPLRTILTIAVIAASLAVPGLLPGTLAETTIFGSLTVGTAAQIGTSILGLLIVNAIAPPSRPKLPSLSGSTRAESPVYAIEGARNDARPFGRVPRVLGEHRHFPPYAALPYTEIVGDDEFVRMLFCWSIGPVDVVERKFGETLLSSFSGTVEREFRRGYQAAQITDRGAWDASSGAYPTPAAFGDKYTVSVAGTVDGVAYVAGDTIVHNGLASETLSAGWDKNGDQPLTLFNDDVFQEDLAVAVTAAGGREVRTTQPGADEIGVDVTFLQGLVTFDDAGNKLNTTVDVLVEVSPAGAGTWTTVETLTVTANRASTVRAGTKWPVANGQYDVGLTRLTADSSSTKVFDVVTWTALRTIAHQDPVAEPGLALEALRVKATGELNRVIDSYNGVVTSIVPDWDSGSSSWIHRKSRNPASLYRAVLQDAGNPRPVPDTRIDLPQLEYWHGLNAADGLFFDAVIDFDLSARELLRDIASAGRAGRTSFDGKWSVAIEEPKTVPVQHFTPRNSFGFRGEKAFRALPHGLRMRFPNREKGWRQDERIVYRDGFNAANATEFEGLEQFGATDPRQVWLRGREHLATAVLRPELYRLSTDIEFLVCARGDLIRVQHDVILAGLASGRVKSVQDDGGGNATGVTVDELLEMEAGKSYVLRFRKQDGSSLLQAIVTATGGVTAVTFTATIPLANAPDPDDLFMFGETGLETIEGIVTGIRPRADLTAEITFVDAAPEIHEAVFATRDFAPADVTPATERIAIAGHPFHDADTVRVSTTGTLPGGSAALTDYRIVGRTDGDFQLSLTEGGAPVDLTDGGAGTHTVARQIPDFDSKITAPAAAAVPATINVRSDGTVLIREPDGSYTSRILLSLKKPLGLQTAIVGIEARFRESGSAGPWSFVTVGRDAGELSLMPVEDGLGYDYQLRYVLKDGAGDWTLSASHTVIGKDGDPSDIPFLAVQQKGDVVNIEWGQIADKDRNGATIRYAAQGADPAGFDNWKLVTRATRGTFVTNAALPPGDWVIGIKAVDTSENESTNAVTKNLTVTAGGNLGVFQRIEAPRWAGTLTGFLRHDVSGTLVPESTKLASDHTNAELFEQFVPFPVATSTYEAKEIDLTFDSIDTRLFAPVTAATRPDRAGIVSEQLEVDYRTAAGAYDGFEAWSVGTAPVARFVKMRVVVDNASAPGWLEQFDPTADIVEREDVQRGLVIAAGGTRVNFLQPFHGAFLPAIELTAKTAAGAARIPNWDAVTQDALGFYDAVDEVHVFDQAGVDVGGTVDLIARGP